MLLEQDRDEQTERSLQLRDNPEVEEEPVSELFIWGSKFALEH